MSESRLCVTNALASKCCIVPVDRSIPSSRPLANGHSISFRAMYVEGCGEPLQEASQSPAWPRLAAISAVKSTSAQPLELVRYWRHGYANRSPKPDRSQIRVGGP